MPDDDDDMPDIDEDDIDRFSEDIEAMSTHDAEMLAEFIQQRLDEILTDFINE